VLFPDVYSGVADLYVYFYAQSLKLLRENGVLTFISSNKFLRAGYGKNLRTYLSEQTSLETLIDFGDLPIFDATTYPFIAVIRKRRPDEETAPHALNVREMATLDVLPQAVSTARRLPQKTLRSDGWQLADPATLALLEKLRGAGTPLGEYVNRKFYRGIVTGLNKAFVIDRQTRDRLIAEDPRSAEIIKPWLRGRDVKRWRVEWAELYVIFTRRGVNIRQYPAIHAYLMQFKDRLMPGVPGGRKPGSYHWYEIQDNTAYYAEFEKPKIVYPDISKRPEFAFDGGNHYVANTMYIINFSIYKYLPKSNRVFYDLSLSTWSKSRSPTSPPTCTPTLSLSCANCWRCAGRGRA